MANKRFTFYRLFIITVIILLSCTIAATASSNARWYKGNLHTHTLWSDADDYPEMVVGWYKTNGYNFLALSDHNILLQGQKWIDANDNRGGKEAFQKYLECYSDWVERRIVDGNELVRLKPLNEFRCLFEEPGRFLLIPAEEITGKKKTHANAINLQTLIEPQIRETAVEILQDAITAVLNQSRDTNQLMLCSVNHPNWHWTITAEDMIKLDMVNFFEVYNGHPHVRNYGDEYHASNERMWDIILTKRLAELNQSIIYGVATDDAHRYHIFDADKANPGRGWVMVKTEYLTPEYIINAMESGDFYASTGVILKDIEFDGKTFRITIKPEKDISYTTQFIGTLKDYNSESKAVTDPNGLEMHATRIYSSDIGKVLAEVKGTAAVYKLRGDEIYVRAKVVSTKPKLNPFAAGDFEVAWIQPVVPKKR
jgi:hypothetical protein